MDQLTSRLLLYGDLGGDSILEELSRVFSDWKKGNTPKAVLVRRVYDQIKRLLDLATDYGFDEDLWQSYLTFLLLAWPALAEQVLTSSPSGWGPWRVR